MEIAEVQNRESLERYLGGLPEGERREVAVRVAYRAAARVLPLALYEAWQFASAPHEEQTSVSSFGVVLISSFGEDTFQFDASLGSENTNLSGTALGHKSSSAAFNSGVTAHLSTFFYVTPDDFDHHDFKTAMDCTVDAVVLASYASSVDWGSIWASLRNDLSDKKGSALWENEAPPLQFSDAWEKSKAYLTMNPTEDWSFWIAWYERVLAGRDILSNEILSVLKTLRDEDWEKGPAHINPMFDGVLAQYRAQDLALGAGDLDIPANGMRNIKAIRSQVTTLQDYLDAEYLFLSGHNARNREQDDILDILKDLKALVESMMERFESSGDDNQAVAIVRETLPAVVEKAGELAIVETEPVVSGTIVTMSASIKMLVDAGADPKLATQIAMSDAAGKKLWPSFQRLFAWGKSSGEKQ